MEVVCRIGCASDGEYLCGVVDESLLKQEDSNVKFRRKPVRVCFSDQELVQFAADYNLGRISTDGDCIATCWNSPREMIVWICKCGRFYGKGGI